MELLQLCNEMFKDTKILPKFRDMIADKKIICDNDQKFSHYLISYLGSRSYNKFLDYSLLATKLNYIFSNMKGISAESWYGTEGDEGTIKELIGDLLYDDRHDLWQNMPYYLEDIYKNMEKGPDKENFWKYIVNAIIDCINVHGTNDVSASFIVEE
ncbi:hypothetical protein KAW18_15815 [candidate division WOR-3 bacterium]|nr:hypothetical protein [candidate division WOR-3 bacterium]